MHVDLFVAALYILYPGMYVLGGLMYLLTAMVLRRNIVGATERDLTRHDVNGDDLKHD